MNDSGNRRAATRWVPSHSKVKKLISRIPRIFASAPLNVRGAAERVAKSADTDTHPDAEDLAVLLLWTAEQKSQKRSSRHRAPPSPPPPPPVDLGEVPDTMFARRARQLDEETSENPIGKRLRSRLGVKRSKLSRGKKIHIKGDN